VNEEKNVIYCGDINRDILLPGATGLDSSINQTLTTGHTMEEVVLKVKHAIRRLSVATGGGEKNKRDQQASMLMN
jgi:hypothetical protein